MKNLVEIKDGKAVTTSLKIAEKFGKRHTHVLRKIDEIISLRPDFAQPNFGLLYRINNLNNSQHVKYYELTEAGYSIAVMSFTGEKALQFKIDYITEFEKMRNAVESNQVENYKTQSAWAMGELEAIMKRQPNHRQSLACVLGLKTNQVGGAYDQLVSKGKLFFKDSYVRVRKYSAPIDTDIVIGQTNYGTLLFSDDVKKYLAKQTDV